MERIRIMGFSYAFSCFMDCSIAASRGIGKSIPPTIIIILGSCVFRVIWFYTVFAHFQTISSLYLLYIFSWGNYRLCGGSVLCCKLPENSDLILQIYSARRSIDLALFISFSRFMYICLYKADIIVYNYPVVLLRDAVIPA